MTCLVLILIFVALFYFVDCVFFYVLPVAIIGYIIYFICTNIDGKPELHCQARKHKDNSTDKGRIQSELQVMKNLIAIMTPIATDEELARVVKYTQSLINAEKNNYDLDSTYIDYVNLKIFELKAKYLRKESQQNGNQKTNNSSGF